LHDVCDERVRVGLERFARDETKYDAFGVHDHASTVGRGVQAFPHISRPISDGTRLDIAVRNVGDAPSAGVSTVSR
jgi:hypothetical protein